MQGNRINFLLANVWEPVFEDPPAEKTSFTKEEVDKMITEEQEKGKGQAQKYLTELKAIQQRTKMTDEERKALEKRIEDMESQLLTKEELAKQTQDKLAKKYEKELAELGTERNNWKTKYSVSTIQRAIVDAAIGAKAYNPEQVTALLGPSARLIDILDEEGKPTGEFDIKIKLSDKNKDGKPITLDLSPSEAVKRLSEREDYMNLFKADGSGGVGGTNARSSGKNIDLKELAKDPVAYRKARAEGRIP